MNSLVRLCIGLYLTLGFCDSTAAFAAPAQSYDQLVSEARSLERQGETLASFIDYYQASVENPNGTEASSALARALLTGLPSRIPQSVFENVAGAVNPLKVDLGLNGQILAVSPRVGEIAPISDPQNAWPFTRVTYYYRRSAKPVGDWDCYAIVHTQTIEDQELGGRMARLLSVLRQALIEETTYVPLTDGKPFGVWLTRHAANSAGGEMWQNNIYFYDVARQRSQIEWIREVAHEYSHLALPAIGGYYTDPEPWANGYYGERLLLRWLHRGAAGGAAAVENAWGGTFEGYVNFEQLLVTPYLADFKSTGLDKARLSRTDGEGMRYLIGMLLAIDDRAGPKKLADMLWSLPQTGEVDAKSLFADAENALGHPSPRAAPNTPSAALHEWEPNIELRELPRAELPHAATIVPSVAAFMSRSLVMTTDLRSGPDESSQLDAAAPAAILFLAASAGKSGGTSQGAPQVPPAAESSPSASPHQYIPSQTSPAPLASPLPATPDRADPSTPTIQPTVKGEPAIALPDRPSPLPLPIPAGPFAAAPDADLIPTALPQPVPTGEPTVAQANQPAFEATPLPTSPLAQIADPIPAPAGEPQPATAQSAEENSKLIAAATASAPTSPATPVPDSAVQPAVHGEPTVAHASETIVAVPPLPTAPLAPAPDVALVPGSAAEPAVRGEPSVALASEPAASAPPLPTMPLAPASDPAPVSTSAPPRPTTTGQPTAAPASSSAIASPPPSGPAKPIQAAPAAPSKSAPNTPTQTGQPSSATSPPTASH